MGSADCGGQLVAQKSRLNFAHGAEFLKFFWIAKAKKKMSEESNRKTSKETKIRIGEKYKHKTTRKNFTIVLVVMHCITGEVLVIYTELPYQEKPVMWACPRDTFTNGQFELIQEKKNGN